MKYILLIFFCFTFFKVSAQKNVNNIDSVYYLLDTTSTPIRERMWDVGIESRYKYFTIKCPCLKYGNEPTFIYNINDPGEKRTESYILKLNTVSLSKLIDLAKKTTDLTAHTLYIFYLVEKNSNSEYSIHKTRLLTPRKPQVSIDYEDIPNKEK